jgi:uncharacterized membrane protein YdjX (TVP38/TMEM64 family)
MRQNLLKALVVILLICGIVGAGILLRPYFEVSKLQTLLSGLGVWAPLLFILTYALATIFFLPGSILTLTGGFLFGPCLGLAYNLCGAMLGATVAFIISRWVASDWVANKVGGKVKRLKEGVEKEGWKFVAVVRLIPAIPFNLLNYALGLTRVSLGSYVMASLIFMIPGAFAYTYLGHLGMQAMTGDTRNLIKNAFIALSLLVVVAVIPWLVKTLRKKDLKLED